MLMIIDFQKSIKRLQDIDWVHRSDDKASLHILVSEFIRRGNVFRDIYEPDNKKRMAIFSAAQSINKPIEIDIDGILSHSGITNQGWTTQYLCKYFLEWCYLNTQGIEEAIKIPDIYEPIIRFYERGGMITYHNNELICGRYFWRKNCYHIPREPQYDISTNALDILDLSMDLPLG